MRIDLCITTKETVGIALLLKQPSPFLMYTSRKNTKDTKCRVIAHHQCLVKKEKNSDGF